MTVELSHKDLVSLVKGIEPYYNVMGHPLVGPHGYFVGGFTDKWFWWTGRLEKLSEQELFDIYVICRDSWK